jgi:hypothetical protein
MPPRIIAWAIVVFWLATSVWLFHHEIWPHLRRGDAPPFSIDLAYEAEHNGSATSWSVFRGKQQLGYIHTWVEYNKTQDTFWLVSRPQGESFQHLDLDIGPLHVQASSLEWKYEVTRDGELRKMNGHATLNISGTGIAKLLKFHCIVGGGGEVKNEQFLPNAYYIDSTGVRQDLPLDPVPFTTHDSILNPMHPVSRITGLRRGQHWNQKLVNPLADCAAALAQKYPGLELLTQRSAQPNVLLAQVLPDTEELDYDHRLNPCLVIEFRGGDLVAHTWVRESDGRVLKQEAILYGERLLLERL